MKEKFDKNTLGICLKNVRATSPLIHSITNYVTVNDVANIILACGASPLMSDEPLEVGEITAISDGLNLNIGTLNKSSIEAMKIAGIRSVELGHPIVLDPAGFSASPLRKKVALALLDVAKPTVIKGNASEIKAFGKELGVWANAGEKSAPPSIVANVDEMPASRGVDASAGDEVTAETLELDIQFAKELSEKTGCIIVMTGATDLVADKETCFVIGNGRAEMEKVTGTGCMMSGLTASFVSANRECPLTAVTASVCAMGLAGEIAWERMADGDGNATYRNKIIDAIYNMTADKLACGAKVEVR